MITQELIDWVKQQIQQGAKPDDIRQILLASGWTEIYINQALNQTSNSANVPIPVPLPPVDQKILRRNGIIGLIWLITPMATLILTLILWGISYAIIPGVGELGKAILSIVNILLSLLGLVSFLGLFVGFIVGIIYLSKSDF